MCGPWWADGRAHHGIREEHKGRDMFTVDGSDDWLGGVFADCKTANVLKVGNSKLLREGSTRDFRVYFDMAR